MKKWRIQLAIVLGQANASELVSLRQAGFPIKFATKQLTQLFERTHIVPLPLHEQSVVIGTPDRIADLIFASAPNVLDRALAIRPRI
jgi:hypothetical protein